MYAKVFTQIFDSTLADNWQHRHVFEDLLKLADQRGFVDMTPESIIARTRLPKEMVMDALEALMRPDPRSRSKEEHGRRIVLIDPDRPWGWRIVNYLHYRAVKNEFDRTAYMRNYMREKRSLNSSLTESNNVKLSPSASASLPKEKESEEKPETAKSMSYVPTPESTARFERLRAALHEAMRRKPKQHWDYAEMSLLCEVNKREGVEDELAELLAFQKRAGRYFPHSLYALLSRWSETLDQSRQPTETNGIYRNNGQQVNGNTGTLNKPSAEKAARYTAIARRGLDKPV